MPDPAPDVPVPGPVPEQAPTSYASVCCEVGFYRRPDPCPWHNPEDGVLTVIAADNAGLRAERDVAEAKVGRLQVELAATRAELARLRAEGCYPMPKAESATFPAPSSVQRDTPEPPAEFMDKMLEIAHEARAWTKVDDLYRCEWCEREGRPQATWTQSTEAMQVHLREEHAAPPSAGPEPEVCSKCGTAGCLEDARSGWYDDDELEPTAGVEPAASGSVPGALRSGSRTPGSDRPTEGSTELRRHGDPTRSEAAPRGGHVSSNIPTTIEEFPQVGGPGMGAPSEVTPEPERKIPDRNHALNVIAGQLSDLYGWLLFTTRYAAAHEALAVVERRLGLPVGKDVVASSTNGRPAPSPPAVPSEALIERAARAAHRAFFGEYPVRGWDEIDADHRRSWHDVARAVLGAAREEGTT
jgi:hypothetical protein